MRFALPRTPSRAITATLLALTMLVASLGLPVLAAATPLTALNLALVYGSPAASGDPMLVIFARIPDATPLPAEMVLPLPENPSVFWVGEFIGDEGRENIPVEAVQEVRDGVPVLVFTLTQSHIGLAEVSFPGSRTLVDALGDIYEVGFDLTMPVDVANVYAAIALPSDIEALESSEVVAVSDEPDGNRYHSFERAGVLAGDQVALTMQVRPIAEQEMVNETVPWMVIAVAAIIIGAAVPLLVTRRQSSAANVD